MQLSVVVSVKKRRTVSITERKVLANTTALAKHSTPSLVRYIYLLLQPFKRPPAESCVSEEVVDVRSDLKRNLPLLSIQPLQITFEGIGNVSSSFNKYFLLRHACFRSEDLSYSEQYQIIFLSQFQEVDYILMEYPFLLGHSCRRKIQHL